MKEQRAEVRGVRGSIFPRGALLEGEIEGTGDLIVLGTVAGPIRIAGTLTIEQGGLVRGNVSAHTVIVRGTLEGGAHGEALVRLEPGSRMIGDAKAERVVLVDGALLRGRVSMGGRGGEGHPDRPREPRGESARLETARDEEAQRVPQRTRDRGRRLADSSAERTHARIQSVEPSPIHIQQSPPLEQESLAPPSSPPSVRPESKSLPLMQGPDTRKLALPNRNVGAEPSAQSSNVPSSNATASVVRDAPASDVPPRPLIPRLHKKQARRKDDA